MDYEKKYNEALERAKKIHDEILNNELLGFPDQIREIFPELRGSEDERIRKWLVDYYSSIKKTVWFHRDITCEQILAWLEKQKEPSWKPSEDQMKALEVAFRKDGDDKYRSTINSLYNDLKKL